MQQKGSSEENATTQRSKATTEKLNRSEAASSTQKSRKWAVRGKVLRRSLN